MVTMSDSSPTDLATVFRSLPRRLREAQGELTATTIDGEVAAIDREVAKAARLMRSAADPTSIAEAIEAVPAGAWGTELDELRVIALDIGAHLRAVAAENPDLDD
jgi:hypothetical protein